MASILAEGLGEKLFVHRPGGVAHDGHVGDGAGSDGMRTAGGPASVGRVAD